MDKSTCIIEGCEYPASTAGRCNTHYFHALRDGECGNRVECAWPECGSGARARKLCDKHYKRAKRMGNFDTPWQQEANDAKALEAERVCKWPECSEPSRVHKWKLCANHYARAERYGDFDKPWEIAEAARAARESITCRWLDCGASELQARDLCRKHYLRAYNMGDFDSPWLTYRPYGVPEVIPPCKWEGCERESAYAGYCRRDYSRAKALGNFDDPWNNWKTSGKCIVCGKRWKNVRNRNKRVCSNACNAARWQQMNPERARELKMDASRRRRARLAGVTVESFTIKDVRMARGDVCYLCGKRINYKLRFPHPQSPSLDHVIPISAGGAHSLENVAMAHMGCNNSKNSRPTDKTPIDTLFSI